jgi:hypothetical protein
MMAGGDLERGRSYCILRGETVSGETIEVRPIELTNALYSRTWTMVNATIANQSFRLLINCAGERLNCFGVMGDVDKLPPGARISGSSQNVGSSLQRSSTRVVPATSESDPARYVSLGRWAQLIPNYDNFIETWVQGIVKTRRSEDRFWRWRVRSIVHGAFLISVRRNFFLGTRPASGHHPAPTVAMKLLPWYFIRRTAHTERYPDS